MLGAGIRLGEALVSREPGATREPAVEGRLAARLGALEDRLEHLETESPKSSIEKQAAEVEAIRSQLAAGDEKLEAVGAIGLRLRGDLEGWLENSVAARMADVESKLRAESEQSRKQMLDAFVETVQTRVMHRIARLEEEVAGQSVAMTELRECSLRTEQSVQKLLGGLDRLVLAQQAPAAKPEAPAPKPEAPAVAEPEIVAEAPEQPPPAMEPVARSRRWGIFG